MCIKEVEKYPWHLANVLHHLKTQKMCDDAISTEPYLLQYVSVCFINLKEMWYEDFEDWDKFGEW